MQVWYPSQYQIPNSYKYKENHHCTGNSHSNRKIVIIKLRKIITTVKVLIITSYSCIKDINLEKRFTNIYKLYEAQPR